MEGYGYTDSTDVIMLEAYDTNIGEIIISHISITSGGMHFEFKGSGSPKGELKDSIQ